MKLKPSPCLWGAYRSADLLYTKLHYYSHMLVLTILCVFKFHENNVLYLGILCISRVMNVQ